MAAAGRSEKNSPRTKHAGMGADQFYNPDGKLTRRRFLQSTAAGAAGIIFAPDILK
jgi:hypothetical protein